MTQQQAGTNSGTRLAPLGRGLIGAGLVLLVLRGLSLSTQLPGMPGFWYTNQALWVCLGFGLTALGWQILWGQPRLPSDGWRPSVPGRRFQSIVVYTKEGCHLCDDAADLLSLHQRWLPVVQKIDIESDQALIEQFQTCVPVIVFDGKIRFRGRINEVLLRRLIEGTPPQEKRQA